jgi:hypothetical protein
VPAWGTSTFNNGHAVFAYLRATNLFDPNDDPVDMSTAIHTPDRAAPFTIAPNPARHEAWVNLPDGATGTLLLRDAMGRLLMTQAVNGRFRIGPVRLWAWDLCGHLAGGGWGARVGAVDGAIGSERRSLGNGIRVRDMSEKPGSR